MSQHMLIFECDQRFVFDDQYFANDSLAMSEQHCRLVSFAPSVQKRASPKKERYQLGKSLFAIDGRVACVQDRQNVGQGLSVSVRVDVGRSRIITTKIERGYIS